MADVSRLRPGSLRSWSWSDALQVVAWLARPWSWLMLPGARPGARSVPGLCSMRSRWSPGACSVPGRGLQVCPWHLSAWRCVELRPLVACPGLCSMSPGGRPWCSFRPWSWSDASRRSPWLARSWLMLDALQVAPWCSFRPWSWSDASRRSPWCLLVPGLCSMRSRLRPGARSVPGLCSMSPGCALVLVSSLAYG